MSYRISRRTKFVSRPSKRSLLKDFAVRLWFAWRNLGIFFDVGHMVTDVVLEVREKVSYATKPFNLH